MSSDNHEFLNKMIKGHSADPLIGGEPADRSELYKMAEVELALYSPGQRATLIRNLDNAIEADANNRDDQGNPVKPGSLRERAQLLSLKRSLEDSHNILKKAGR